MLAHVTILTDEELDAVAAGATVKFNGKLTATGLTKADTVATTNATAKTTKTTEDATADFMYSVTTA